MRSNKEIFKKIIKEEIASLTSDQQLTRKQISDIVDRLIKKLDSIDLSLDLIYSAFIGSGDPVAVTTARTRAAGRAMRARVPSPAPAAPVSSVGTDRSKSLNEREEGYMKKMMKGLAKPVGAYSKWITDTPRTTATQTKWGATEKKAAIRGKRADLIKCRDALKFARKGDEDQAKASLADIANDDTREQCQQRLGRAQTSPEEAPAGTPPAGKAQLEKDTPLSINTRQKGVIAAAGGARELPLNMYIQKLGLDNRTAQKIARRIGDYLEQRNIPIAEMLESGFIDSLIEKIILSEEIQLILEKERSNVSAIKSSIFGSLRNITSPRAKPETKKKGAEYVLGLHGVAKQANPEKFRKFLIKRFGGFGGRVEQLSEEELKELMNYITTSDLFKKYHKAGLELRKQLGAEKAEKRGSLRGVGAEAGVLGKVVSRYVSDNQDMLAADEKLKALFDDPAKFSKFANTIRKNVARMMQRRGYEEAEIGKLLESLKEGATI